MVGKLITALMCGVGATAVLRWAAPGPAELLSAVQSPEQWVGLHGADSAVLVVAAMVGWLVLAWLVAGIVILAATELPGLAGRVAGHVAAVVLPAALRQGLALSLGIGLVTAGSGVAAAEPASGAPPGPTPGASVDWPQQPPLVPDPPPTGPPVSGPPEIGDPIDGVVVAAGDSLWKIAANRLGPQVGDPAIATAVQDWYTANRAVIGSDPDLIHPGQRLMPPGASS